MTIFLWLLLFFVTPAHAQCNGVFSANQVCGTGATAATPGPIAGPVATVVGDTTGVADTSAACMAAFNSLPIGTGGTVIFPPGKYNFTANCTLPAFASLGSLGAKVNVIMTGAVLQTTTSGVHIFDRAPPNQATANVWIGAAVNFYDGLLTGSKLSNQIGINLGATYSSRIVGTDFQNLGTGLDCQFCLALRVEGSKGTTNVTYDWLVENGSWSGAGTCGAQSNAATFEGVRSYANTGMTAALGVHASDAVTVHNSVFEGNNPVHEIDFNDETCTTVKSFGAYNIHVENSPSSSIAVLSGIGNGTYTFDTFIFQASIPNPVIDISGLTSNAAVVVVSNWPTLANLSAPYFNLSAAEQSAAHFQFYNWGGQSSPDPTTLGFWQSNRRPGLLNIGFDTTNGGGWVNCSTCSIGSSANPGPNHIWGNIDFPTDDTYNIGTNNTTNRPHSIYTGSGGMGLGGSTFANLPASPSTAQMAYVTDGKASNCGDSACTTFGTAVTGGTGSLKLLVWWNGGNWTLIGK